MKTACPSELRLIAISHDAPNRTRVLPSGTRYKCGVADRDVCGIEADGFLSLPSATIQKSSNVDENRRSPRAHDYIGETVKWLRRKR